MSPLGIYVGDLGRLDHPNLPNRGDQSRRGCTLKYLRTLPPIAGEEIAMDRGLKNMSVFRGYNRVKETVIRTELRVTIQRLCVH